MALLLSGEGSVLGLGFDMVVVVDESYLLFSLSFGDQLFVADMVVLRGRGGVWSGIV